MWAHSPNRTESRAWQPANKTREHGSAKGQPRASKGQQGSNESPRQWEPQRASPKSNLPQCLQRGSCLGGFLQVETTWRCVQPLPATLVPFTSFEGGAAAQLLDRSLDHQGSCSLTHASFPPTTVNRFSSCVRARRPTKEMAFLSSRSRLSAFRLSAANYPVRNTQS